MNKLVINTATNELFMAIKKGDEVFFKTLNSKMHHNETMILEIDSLLKSCGLELKNIDEIGVVVGPGSFTGIRVGIATVKAFRDSLNIKVKGINNLKYLFELAREQDKEIQTVAILGSKDSYFVARYINEEVYIYERNLSLEELVEISHDGTIGMFEEDKVVNCVKLEQNAKVLFDCLKESNDETLVPVYYQLSQAESEKLKKATLNIELASCKDLNEIFVLETENIKTNTLSKEQIELALKDNNYIVYKATTGEELAGFIVLQITDEINIDSVAVKREYRNLGIATKLIMKAQEVASQKNIEIISLEVNYKNITAYLLYEKLGFKIRRVRKKYYSDGNDGLEMIKRV